jgi:hypothetical protein
MLRLTNLAKIAGLASALYLQNLFCFSKATEYPFIEVVQYNANDPIEDRYSYSKLTSIDGFATSVFDGHGGDLVVLIVVFRLSMLPKISTSASTTESATISNSLFPPSKSSKKVSKKHTKMFKMVSSQFSKKILIKSNTKELALAASLLSFSRTAFILRTLETARVCCSPKKKLQ